MLYIQANEMTYERNGKKIINIARLEFYEGDKIGLIGPNGCGKSTLLKLLAGQLRSDTGKLKRYGSHEYIPQLEQVEAEEVGTKTLRTLQVTHTNLECMSGGEQSRVKLGKMIESYVHFLLIDEPTNYLDLSTIKVLEQTMIDYPGTILFTSHDKKLVDQVADSILEIRDYQVVKVK